MKFITRLVLSLVHLAAILAFTWPFLGFTKADFSFVTQSWLATLIAFFAMAVLASRISAALLDSKAIAIIAVMAGFIAALRLVGAGAVGIEPMWFLLIISARVLGPQLGFTLGVLAMGVSALITGGIGPWLAFQMLAAGWIASGVRLIPSRIRGATEIALLAIYGALASFFFGLAMDMQLWPWLTGIDSQLSYVATLGSAENLARFFLFHIATSMAWDIPRAIFTAALIALTGKAFLASLRRAESRLQLNSRAKEQMVLSR